MTCETASATDTGTVTATWPATGRSSTPHPTRRHRRWKRPREGEHGVSLIRGGTCAQRVPGSLHVARSSGSRLAAQPGHACPRGWFEAGTGSTVCLGHWDTGTQGRARRPPTPHAHKERMAAGPRALQRPQPPPPAPQPCGDNGQLREPAKRCAPPRRRASRMVVTCLKAHPRCLARKWES